MGNHIRKEMYRHTSTNNNHITSTSKLCWVAVANKNVLKYKAAVEVDRYYADVSIHNIDS